MERVFRVLNTQSTGIALLKILQQRGSQLALRSESSGKKLAHGERVSNSGCEEAGSKCLSKQGTYRRGWSQRWQTGITPLSLCGCAWIYTTPPQMLCEPGTLSSCLMHTKSQLLMMYKATFLPSFLEPWVSLTALQELTKGRGSLWEYRTESLQM